MRNLYGTAAAAARRAFRLLLGVLALATALALMPQVGVAASIAALVNNHPISTYDVQQRVQLMQVTGQAMGPEGALNDLIEERLKLQEAARLGISVGDEDVNQAFASIAQRVNLPPDQLVQALGQSGVSADTLKNRLRADIAWQRVVQARLKSEAQVREQDVIAALQTRGAASTGQEAVIEYDLHQIVFVVPEGASAAQRQSEASALRGRFVSCEQTLPQLTGMRDVVVRRIGLRRSIDLPPELRESLRTTGVNGLTPPNTTDGGVEVIAVCAAQEVRDDRAGREEVRQELLGQEMEADARRLMDDLRQTAVIEMR